MYNYQKLKMDEVETESEYNSESEVLKYIQSESEGEIQSESESENMIDEEYNLLLEKISNFNVLKIEEHDLENNKPVNASVTYTFVRNETKYRVINYQVVE